MKAKYLFIFLAALLLEASCETKSANTEKASANAEVTMTMASMLKNDDCFDKKMEHWFIRFNQLQEEGYTMEEANEKAIASARQAFNKCDERQVQIADDASPVIE